MTLIIKRKTYAHRLIGANSDQVFAWAWVPSEGSFLGATVDLHMVSSDAIAWDTVMVYSLAGYALPVDDPDGLPAEPDTYWDKYVPKDKAIAEDALDFDTTSSDIEPFSAMGLHSLENMFDVGANGTKKLFRTERMLSFANSPRTMITTNGSETYMPMEVVRFKVKQKAAAGNRPMLILFAAGKASDAPPNAWIGDVSAWAPGNESAGAAKENWYRSKFLWTSIVQSMPWLTGAGETGAKSVYEKAAELAGRYVEQAFEESASATFNVTNNINVVARVNYTIAVPGQPTMKTLRSAP